jgi:hypothetical protein
MSTYGGSLTILGFVSEKISKFVFYTSSIKNMIYYVDSLTGQVGNLLDNNYDYVQFYISF